MVLTPVEKTDPILRTPCESVTLEELNSNEFQHIIEDMMDYVFGHSNKGDSRDKNKPMTVGLSANQLGISKRISIVDMAIGSKNFNDMRVLINPEIIWHSEEMTDFREGCVNLPEVWGLIPRYREVKVKALDRSGNEITVHAKSWPAVLLQHEIDHLNGFLFIDHLQDPTHAHFVKKDEMVNYRNHEKDWDKFINVDAFVRRPD